jgi:hypothetical protein
MFFFFFHDKKKKKSYERGIIHLDMDTIDVNRRQ